ncbi:MAG: universal stress protein [Woeseiaceae bacterium]
MNTRNIVLAVIEPDINPQVVVERAAWLAEGAGAALELLLCDADVSSLSDTLFVSNEARDIAASIRAAQEEMIDELAQPVRHRDREVTTSVLDQRPVAGGVIYIALDRNPLYVVKGTQYHSQAERAIFVDTDWQLIRACPYPLWLVKPRPLSGKPTIIAAVDPASVHAEPSRLDRSIISHAQHIAARSGGELHLLHTYQTLTGIGTAATRTFKPIRLAVDDITERVAKEHREKLEELAAANEIDAKHAHLLPGNARDVLPYIAREWSADVVVMGAIARSGVNRMNIGSTAEKVLDHLPCDILIIRPDAG